MILICHFLKDHLGVFTWISRISIDKNSLSCIYYPPNFLFCVWYFPSVFLTDNYPTMNHCFGLNSVIVATLYKMRVWLGLLDRKAIGQRQNRSNLLLCSWLFSYSNCMYFCLLKIIDYLAHCTFFLFFLSCHPQNRSF